MKNTDRGPIQDMYREFIADYRALADQAERELANLKPWLTSKIHRSLFNSHLKNNGKIIEMTNLGIIDKHSKVKGTYIFWHAMDGFCGNVGQGNIYDRVMKCWLQIKDGPKDYKNSTGSYQAARHMRDHDPDPDNWSVQYRIVETDSRVLRERWETHFQNVYQPRFNEIKQAETA